MKYNPSLFKFIPVLLISTCLQSCDNGNDGPPYEIPTTYSFDNVSYSGQTDRIKMLSEMSDLMKTGNTSGVAVSSEALKNMYRNENSPFSFSSSRQLKDKTFLPDQSTIETYFDQLAEASWSATAGSNGQAGVVESTEEVGKAYLLDAKGKDLAQIVEKGLMGAVFYYQMTAVYLSEDKIGDDVDNTTVVDGEGTPMEHHWDEAFGYWGVPKDFPTNKNELQFWGEYSNDLDPVLGCNQKIMDAFLKGRAAISAKDMDTKWEMVDVIRTEFEKVVAASAIHELNEAKEYISDDAVRNHVLSEALAFIRALAYNPTQTISRDKIAELEALLGDNFYTVELADINAVKNELASIFGLSAVADSL